ncbi:MAG TPA: protein kinase [Gaiellaceae bacterium]|nr:protein kinase [Gaiellaceae bacterium]
MDVGTVIAGRYELEELSGTGGMANVYRAYDRLLERRVAIKVLHERYSHDTEYVERFRHEAMAIARLSHANIVTVIDRGEWEQHQYIVFEYVEGETLKELVEREGPLSVRDSLVLVREIAHGLAFAHGNGVVHRDVKPHNVIIDSEGTPKVTDFGIARSLDRDEGPTTTGTLLGTSDYLSPEQASGLPVSERSDQYSLGVLLYELLTGDVPYPGRSLVEAAMRHLNDPVPGVCDSRPDVPLAVDELVRTAMQKDPEDRFASTGAFLTALDACLAPFDEDTLSDLVHDHSARAVPARRPQRPTVRKASRAPVYAALVGVLVAVGVAGFAFAILRNGDEGAAGSGQPRGEGDGNGAAPALTLEALADYDPEGDGAEHPEAIAAATDGDPATYWTTETYSSFDKSGVGIVLHASDAVDGGIVVVRSDDDSGYTAEIRASTRADGEFSAVSEPRTVGSRTSFELDTGGDEYRFLLVWIMELGRTGRAHVNEVSVR